MSGADDTNGTSVLVAPDWEGAVDGAIRTHERIYRRMEALADERADHTARRSAPGEGGAPHPLMDASGL